VEVTDSKDAATTHEMLIGSLVDLLDSWSWKVDSEPQIGIFRPDILAFAPDGEPYLIEVKTGGHQGHLGALGQVETYKNAFREAQGREPNAVLLVAGETPAELQGVAHDIGVTLIDGFHNDRASLVDRLSEALPGAQEGPEPTVTK
jgi:RecB family endonuclease NucS